MSGILDSIQQAGTALGSAGAIVAGRVWATMRTATARANAALARVAALEKRFEESFRDEGRRIAREVAEQAFHPYRSLPGALRLEVDTFKEEVRGELAQQASQLASQLAQRARTASRPDYAGIEELVRRQDEIERKLQELDRRLLPELTRRLDGFDRTLEQFRTDIATERGQRHTLGREVAERHNEVMKTCNELNGLVREIKGTLAGMKR